MNSNNLSSDIAILGMGTAPAHAVNQPDIAELIGASLQDRPDLARFAKRIFRSCGVETRYTVEPSYLGTLEECRYLPSAEHTNIPTTRERMDTYQREAFPLAVKAAEQAIQDAGISPEGITHMITVSCTGQYLPGLDVATDSSFRITCTSEPTAADFSRLCGRTESNPDGAGCRSGCSGISGLNRLR